MPEGKLRSGVYRSFIMCDDPRGVVESGAIKKQSKLRSSSICSTTNQSCDHPTKPKERSETAPRKSVELAPPPPPSSSSSLQLLRVSKGIQKLNVAIDSWSKAFRPEDIAKDLLRGALDLEESLAMLSSIQESDDVKKKPRVVVKDGGGRRDLRFQRSMSDRFGERIEKRMMVSQENAAASKDCYEELRKVIRESFLRQNLLPQATTAKESRARVFRSDFASSSGAASSSTSSSQSSMVSGSTKSSASSDVTRRGPSLIARLMGLDVSPQEQSKTSVMPSEKLKKEKKESLETVRCNKAREAVLQSLPEEIPSEDIVLIRPMRVVQPGMEEKPGNKKQVSPKKPRMQGEVHPRMMNQRKDHQAKSSKKMKLPSSLIKKDREPKEMVRKVEENEGGKVSPSNAKAVTRERIPMETKKKVLVKKEDVGECKVRDRPHEKALKPQNNPPVTHKKPNSSSDMSRNKIRRSRLSSSSSSDEQRSSSREKKSGEAKKPNAKKKLHQQDNDLASENNSGSSQDTRGSVTQLSTEEATSSEFNIQGHCDNGEVTSSAPTIQHSLEPETSQISLKSFLSNSQDFLSYAENLFDLNTNTKRSQESTFQNRDSIVISDQRLALDFAKEVAKRRSLLHIEEPTCPQRSSVHIDELLMEVCDGFESLRSYRDNFLGQDSFVKESIDMVLEKDLKSMKTEMTTSGVWDLGWRSEFQIDETYQAVVDLEKLILSGLIHEILS
ncbi:unnamed protein product [Microthlaspi erraticum]|uniref:DUF3741 domain-containing protein n=1 Tax=Microthlaspi erraticum TaxID=1685480 RepID=A0A6D2K0P0_9BRAS|nr:unnamed protein product [Microthlaspi erraticum]